MGRELSYKIKEGTGWLAPGVLGYLISTLSRQLSRDNHHEYMYKSSKGAIKIGIGILTGNKERIRSGKEIMDCTINKYPEIYNKY